MCSRPGTIVMIARVLCVSCARGISRALLMGVSTLAAGGLETVNEVWASTTPFSAPRVWFSVSLFVGGEEAISRRGCALPPPIARPPVAFSRRLALRTRASTLNRSSSRALCGRGGAPLHAQGSSSTSMRCACRAARPPACSGGGGERPSRRRLDAPRGGCCHAAATADRPPRSPGTLAGTSSWTTRTARAAGGSTAGARPLSATLAPSAASPSAPLPPLCGTCEVRLYVCVRVYKREASV